MQGAALSKLESLETLFLDALKDLLDAERQLKQALPRLVQAASAPELRTALEERLESTEAHIVRVTRMLEILGVRDRWKRCIGMAGLIEEAHESIDADESGAVFDAALIGAARKIGHYEMAGYTTARTYALRLGRHDVAFLLQQTLDEEKRTDRKLTILAEDGIADAGHRAFRRWDDRIPEPVTSDDRTRKTRLRWQTRENTEPRPSRKSSGQCASASAARCGQDGLANG